MSHPPWRPMETEIHSYLNPLEFELQHTVNSRSKPILVLLITWVFRSSGLLQLGKMGHRQGRQDAAAEKSS